MANDIASAISGGGKADSGLGIWGGLIEAIGTVVGGAVEAGGAASDPAHNQDAARSVQAGKSIRAIFTPGADVSKATQSQPDKGKAGK